MRRSDSGGPETQGWVVKVGHSTSARRLAWAGGRSESRVIASSGYAAGGSSAYLNADFIRSAAPGCPEHKQVAARRGQHTGPSGGVLSFRRTRQCTPVDPDSIRGMRHGPWRAIDLQHDIVVVVRWLTGGHVLAAAPPNSPAGKLAAGDTTRDLRLGSADGKLHRSWVVTRCGGRSVREESPCEESAETCLQIITVTAGSRHTSFFRSGLSDLAGHEIDQETVDSAFHV